MEQIKYIDAHSHVHFPQFEVDREEVLARMREAGVCAVTVGVDSKTSQEARDFAHAHGLYATVGLHPSDNRKEPLDEDLFRELLKDNRVVAVGECGFDYTRFTIDATEEKARQKDIFLRQMKLAGEAGKPVMIHCRASGKDSEQNTDAHEDAIAAIKEVQKEYPNLIPILHFFTGSPEIAARYTELGAYFSFSGVITFAEMYEKTVLLVPLDKILSETDAPYAAPVPHRGQRNEPAFVVSTLNHIAKIRGVSEEEMRVQVLQNAERIFGIKF